jgi:hypothetical protein
MGRYAVLVGDRVAPTTNHRDYQLPTADGGTVQAVLHRPGFLDPFPTLEVNGARHRTGPKRPVALMVLAIVPMALAGLGGALGALIGAFGMFGNFGIARSRLSTAAAALCMVGVLLVTGLVWLVVASLLVAALDG